MSKKFTGNIKLASAINQTGAQPLDDRVVVASVTDLYNSFGTAIYEGMMVVVNDEHAIYVLTDTTKVTQAAGWKKIGDVSTYKVKGCVANFADLPAAANNSVGDVYNVQNAFTLESKPYPAGTNVVWAPAETAKDAPEAHKVAHWDALGGTVDLSGYVQKTEIGTAAALSSENVVQYTLNRGVVAALKINVPLIINEADPNNQIVFSDAADNKIRIKGAISAGVLILDDGNKGEITLDGIKTPESNACAANKKYVDDTVSSALTWTEI
ncbi:MAG TPA: hypothetical protein DHU75_03125 [Rikenellaceae bacterium]|nr:hypothetical protein [Rikenellaceae bacterium]